MDLQSAIDTIFATYKSENVVYKTSDDQFFFNQGNADAQAQRLSDRGVATIYRPGFEPEGVAATGDASLAHPEQSAQLSEKELADKIAADKAATDKIAADKAAADQAAPDNAAADKAAADQVAADKAAADKAAADQTAPDKAQADQLTADLKAEQDLADKIKVEQDAVAASKKNAIDNANPQ